MSALNSHGRILPLASGPLGAHIDSLRVRSKKLVYLQVFRRIGTGELLMLPNNYLRIYRYCMYGIVTRTWQTPRESTWATSLSSTSPKSHDVPRTSKHHIPLPDQRLYQIGTVL